MASITINAKLSMYGCPACKGQGCFENVPDYDMIRCKECSTKFTGIWLIKWDGTHYPDMQGTQGQDPLDTPLPDTHWTPNVGDSLGANLLKLQEKVVLFREAVVNPDRVTSDEDIEQLLKDVFDVSYALPLPLSLSQEITPDDDEGPSPDEELQALIDEAEKYGFGPAVDLKGFDTYAEALQAAVDDGDITHKTAMDLLAAFGEDPFKPTEEAEDDG